MKRLEMRGGISLLLVVVACLTSCQDQEASQGIPPAPDAQSSPADSGDSPSIPDIEPAPVLSKEGPLPPVRDPESASAVDLYLNLMQASLTDLIYENNEKAREAQTKGSQWPSRAYTMIGVERLDNIRRCVEDVLARDVPGDLLEAGAWRGGATIFMRAILKAHGVSDRTVWVADSFEGLPVPDVEKYPADSDPHVYTLHTYEELAVSLEEAQRNFSRYELLDGQVRFLKGWFSETLPSAPVEQLAVLRIDADMYESTMDVLVHLYPKVSPGGYVILDDYLLIPSCRKAIDDYREEHDIDEEMFAVDWNAAYWKKAEQSQ